MDSNGAVSTDYNELILMEDNEAVPTQWAATKPTEKNYNEAVQRTKTTRRWQVSGSPIPTGNLGLLVNNQEVRVSKPFFPNVFQPDRL